MAEALDKLIDLARTVEMTEGQRYAQRVSFAYGTAKIENDRVTRAMVEAAASSVVDIPGDR